MPTNFVNHGALKGTGAYSVSGTLDSAAGGTVAPGASPGTLALTGNFLQSAGAARDDACRVGRAGLARAARGQLDPDPLKRDLGKLRRWCDAPGPAAVWLIGIATFHSGSRLWPELGSALPSLAVTLLLGTLLRRRG